MLVSSSLPRFPTASPGDRIRERQRLEQQGAYDAEDRGVGADAEASVMIATAVNPGRAVNTRKA